MDAIKEWMAVAAAIVGAVVWLVRLEGRVNKSEDGVNRVEARLTRFENTHHEQAFQRGEGIDYGKAPYLDGNGMAYVAQRSIIRTTLTKAETWGGMNLTLKRFLPTFRVAVA